MILAAALARPQASAPAPGMEVKFSVSNGPEIRVDGDGFVASGFRAGDAELKWLPETAAEDLAPRGTGSAPGVRFTATGLDDQGRAHTFKFTVQDRALSLEVRGFDPSSKVVVRARVRSKWPTLRLRTGAGLSFEPQILHTAIGDPDVDGNIIFAPSADSAVTLLPLGVASAAREDAGGARAIEWRVKSGPAGEIAGLTAEFGKDYLSTALAIPRGEVKGPKTPAAACGWRSGPAYGADVRGHALEEEADAVERKLGAFGIHYFQIDDGWQSSAPGDAASKPAAESGRVWLPSPRGFPKGFAPLVARLKAAKLEPAIWIIPHADGRPAGTTVGLLRDAQGEPYSGGWLGPALWDGGSAEFAQMVERTFKRLAADGFRRFVCDGLPAVADEYKRFNALRPEFAAKDAYVTSLRAIKSAVGDDGRLVCGWYGGYATEQPFAVLEQFGIFDAFRFFEQGAATLSGLTTAAEAVGRGARFNGLATWTDPQAVRVGGGLTLEQARTWASLVALSGQEYFVSEKMATLPQERCDVLRATLPTLPIHTYYAPKALSKVKIVRLWRDHGDDTSLVSGYFSADPEDLKFPQDPLDSAYGEYQSAEKYEYWSGRFIGRAPVHAFDAPLSLPLGSCAVVAYRKPRPAPFVLSSSRHVSQGALDVREEKYDSASKQLSGAADLAAGAETVLSIVAPHRGWRAVSAVCLGRNARFEQAGRLVRLHLAADDALRALWMVQFAEGDAVQAPKATISNIVFKPNPDGTTVVRWSAANSPAGSFLVKRDGQLLASCVRSEFADAETSYNSTYVYEVTPVDDEGNAGEPLSAEVTTTQPPAVPLTSLPYSTKHGRSMPVRVNENYLGKPMKVRGRAVERGFGLTSPVVLEVSLRGLQGVFRADVAIDDAAENKGSAVLKVVVDGATAASTPIFRGGEKPLPVRARVPAGAKTLTILVESADDGMDYDFVDLMNPEIGVVPAETPATRPK